MNIPVIERDIVIAVHIKVDSVVTAVENKVDCAILTVIGQFRDVQV